MPCIRLALLTVILCVAGCSKTPTALVERQATALEEAATILKEIADAKPSDIEVRESTDLQHKFRRLGQLQRQIDKLVRATADAKISDEARDELEDTYRERMASAAEEFHTQLARVRELKLKTGGLSDLDALLFDKSS
jgi:hypothetical protein